MVVWNNLKALAYVNKQFTTNQASLHLYHWLHHQHVWHFLFSVLNIVVFQAKKRLLLWRNICCR